MDSDSDSRHHRSKRDKHDKKYSSYHHHRDESSHHHKHYDSKKDKRERDRDRDKDRDHHHDKYKDKKDKEKRKSKDHKKSKERSRDKSHKHHHKSKDNKKSKETSRKKSSSSSSSSSSNDEQKQIQNTIPISSNYIEMMKQNGYLIPYPQFINSKYFLNPNGMFGNSKLMPQDNQKDKVVKDQNYLNSDDKIFDSIINHCLSMKYIFADCQFSENKLGSYLYRAIKKNILDNNFKIFDNIFTPEGIIAEKYEKLNKDSIIIPTKEEIFENEIEKIINCEEQSLNFGNGELDELYEKLVSEK